MTRIGALLFLLFCFTLYSFNTVHAEDLSQPAMAGYPRPDPLVTSSPAVADDVDDLVDELENTDHDEDGRNAVIHRILAELPHRDAARAISAILRDQEEDSQELRLWLMNEVVAALPSADDLEDMSRSQKGQILGVVHDVQSVFFDDTLYPSVSSLKSVMFGLRLKVPDALVAVSSKSALKKEIDKVRSNNSRREGQAPNYPEVGLVLNTIHMPVGWVDPAVRSYAVRTLRLLALDGAVKEDFVAEVLSNVIETNLKSGEVEDEDVEEFVLTMLATLAELDPSEVDVRGLENDLVRWLNDESLSKRLRVGVAAVLAHHYVGQVDYVVESLLLIEEEESAPDLRKMIWQALGSLGEAASVAAAQSYERIFESSPAMVTEAAGDALQSFGDEAMLAMSPFFENDAAVLRSADFYTVHGRSYTSAMAVAPLLWLATANLTPDGLDEWIGNFDFFFESDSDVYIGWGTLGLGALLARGTDALDPQYDAAIFEGAANSGDTYVRCASMWTIGRMVAAHTFPEYLPRAISPDDPQAIDNYVVENRPKGWEQLKQLIEEGALPTLRTELRRELFLATRTAGRWAWVLAPALLERAKLNDNSEDIDWPQGIAYVGQMLADFQELVAQTSTDSIMPYRGVPITQRETEAMDRVKETLAQLLNSADIEVAIAAQRVLGRIGGES